MVTISIARKAKSQSVQTAKQLKKIRGKLLYIERQQRRLRKVERSQDARVKFKIGLLIVKARLHEESDALLYGLAIDASEKLSSPDGKSYQTQWRVKGDLAFSFEKKMLLAEKKVFNHTTIKQGALFKKVKLHEQSTAVLYGLLLYAKEQLEEELSIETRITLTKKGETALLLK